jgi:hypothetical protein
MLLEDCSRFARLNEVIYRDAHRDHRVDVYGFVLDNSDYLVVFNPDRAPLL